MSVNDIKVIETEKLTFEEQIMLLVESLKKEIKELRVDVDKLIENGR